MNLVRKAEELRSEGNRMIREGYHCIECAQPFKFGTQGEPGVNVYSDAGIRELAITTVCESCYDCMFKE